MNDLPVPKYHVGQKVLVAHGFYGQQRKQCSDCLGTLKWRLILPTGEEFSIDCGSCSWGFEGPHGWVNDYGPTVSIKNFTIGSVKIDTWSDRPVQYMCVETGVGSGSVYDEESIFLDRDQAEAWAKVQADEATAAILDREEKGRAQKKRDVRKPSKK